MNRPVFAAALLLVVSSHASDSAPAQLAWPVDKYDVAWDSPSQDARGSMPLGNGDIGLNVWVEPNGDLVLLVAKTDSYDEFNRLLKLGRIRIKTTPALVQPGQSFSQVLRLSDGLIEIKAGDTNIRVWVDANHPVAQVDMTGAHPVAVDVTLEDWRKAKRGLAGTDATVSEGHSAWGNWLDKFQVNPDTILPAKGDQLAWCHHNDESQWKRNLELTGLASEIPKEEDPVLDRTFGAIVRGSGCAVVSGTELQTGQPVKSCSIQIFPLTCKAASADAWLALATAGADNVQRLPEAARFTGHEAWWRSFWNRSWIDIGGGSMSDLLTYRGPLQLGHDPAGQNRFAGTISSAYTANRALADAEITRLASAEPGASISGSTEDISLAGSFTTAAWIKPAPGEGGRIFDKSTPARGDGLLFDTYPGLSLRFGVGGIFLNKPYVLKAGEWQHVASTFDAASGRQSLYLNGKLLDSRVDLPDSAVVSRACALQRFIAACAGRGALPIKFNGTLFTVEGPDPDFRLWGGAYWFQNTRLNYWPMLDSGDYDMMLPYFAMYRNALPLREAATQTYYHHAGAFFPETIYFWGNYVDGNYGLDRHGKSDGLADNTFIRRYWQGGIELTAMMLDYYDDTQDAAFREKTLLPIARDVVTFFDQHWPRGADGKICFEPAQSLETWQTAKNPLPDVAGLRYVIPRLLQLPVDAATKEHWQKTLADLPPVPMLHDKDGARLLPAETYSDNRNVENPELYAVFPYPLYTCLASDEDKQIGLNTWRHRAHGEDTGWQQNSIQAALLGLAGEAKAMVVRRASATAASYRFPGFFGPNFDWTPDQDHANNIVTATQRMLMQCDGRRIVLLPALPADWNASFRLHAPLNTIVEGHVENGKLTMIKVTPESRHKDVEVRTPGHAE